MNPRTALSYGGILLSVCLLACHKDSSKPSPGSSQTPLGTININLTYPYPASPVPPSFELNISEPGGKVLLDDIFQVNSYIHAGLATNAKVVDVTVIMGDAASGFLVRVFKGVDPSKWTDVIPGSYRIPYRSSYPNTTAAHLYCTHFPAAAVTGTDYLNAFVFANGAVNAQTPGTINPTDPANYTLSQDYRRYPGAYTFLLLPRAGLCKFYLPTKDYDTLDLSSMDQAIAVSFPRTKDFTIQYPACSFLGLPDATDVTRAVNFLDPLASTAMSYASADFFYPKQPMQAYETYISVSTKPNETMGYYSYGKSVPTTLSLPDPAGYTLLSKQNDSFAIRFTGSKPTYYTTNWYNSKVNLFITASPDSGVIHPVSLLTRQKNKLLSGLTISDVLGGELTFASVGGMDYNGYFNFFCDPAKAKPGSVASCSDYSIGF